MRAPYQIDPTYELYEYAFHESNYGLPDILKGARMDEKRKAETARGSLIASYTRLPPEHNSTSPVT